jgi:hypothetical protein
MLHKIAITMAVIAVFNCASDARARGEKSGLAETGGTYLGHTLPFGGDPDDHHPVFQRVPLSSAHVDLGVRGYGCIAHPDYGLYTPHFC